jgi:hypothetical protein
MSERTKVAFSENVIAVLIRRNGKREIFRAKNLIGDAGDKNYAQRVCAESPTLAFTTLELGDDVSDATGWSVGHPAKASTRAHMSSKIGSTQKAVTALYPKTADADADNTGAGVDVVSWLFSYAKADFANANIIAGLITITGPAAGSDILTGFSFAAKFGKTADDTLKVFVNHTANGI